MTEPIIRVDNLVKHFGNVRAVDGVSFDVGKGEVFGLLGPNGAGKTTTFETIEGLHKPTSGRTIALGIDTHKDIQQVKERIGVQLQASAYFDFLTLNEILRLFAGFYSRHVAPRDLLARVGLLEKADSAVSTLSGGQKQRFTIAAALINDPEVVFLDEPTTGLDPQARRSVWDLIQQIHGEGRTVVLTTHYMEEAETLCQRVAIMDLGKVAALETPASLIRGLPTPYRIKLVSRSKLPREELCRLDGIKDVKQAASDGEDVCILSSTNAGTSLSALLARLQQAGITLEHMEVIPATLEDVFLSLTGKQLRD